MRVENPRFDEGGLVSCAECPFPYGSVLCIVHDCPRNMEEYTAACLMAEEAAKGGNK